MLPAYRNAELERYRKPERIMQNVVGMNPILPSEERVTSPIVPRRIGNPGVQSLIPGMSSVRLNKILVPLGFSAASEKVLPHAVALPSNLVARLSC